MFGTYNHNGTIGVLVELESEFSALPDKAYIKLLADNIAMHIAASKPRDVSELLLQSYIKDPDYTVSKILNDTSQDFNDSLTISRFIRWEQETGDDVTGPENEPMAAAVLKQA